jgi:hypothetical protein
MARRPAASQSGQLMDVAYLSGVSAIVFMLFVAAGSAYVVLAKLNGIGPVFVTFVPVVIMFAYAGLIWLARNLRLRDDQAGDNLYYMGFLFTLTSLGVSLYQFNASRAAEEIVQNFGIAIGSTITGIALRVIFNQMRRDPVEIERTMRLELAEAARRVRRELDSTVVEFGYVRRSAQQAAADSFAQVAEKFDEIAVKLLAGMEDLAAKSAQPLEAASQRSRDMIGALAATAEQLASETERLSKGTAEVAATVEETAKLMRVPAESAASALEPVVTSLARAVDRLTAQFDGQATMIANMLETAKLAAEISSVSMEALRHDIAADSAANRTALEAATGVIADMTRILDEYKTDARDQAETLRSLMARTDAAIRSFGEVLARSGAAVSAEFRAQSAALQPIPNLAPAGERRTEIAEDGGTRRATAKREAIK